MACCRSKGCATRVQWVLMCLLCYWCTGVLCFGQFFVPRVRVVSEALDAQSARYLPQIEHLLVGVVRGFAPGVECIAPSHPLSCEVTYTVTSAVGETYKGDLTLRFFRPVYEQKELTLLANIKERDLRLEYRPYGVMLPQKGRVPEDPFLRQMYYYLLVGAWLYYDSFGDGGGSPFLDYLQKTSSDYYRPMSMRGEVDRGLVPERLLPLLRDKSSELFREVYYLYHRQGLDQVYKSKRSYLETLSLVLDLLDEVKAIEPRHPLLELFADAKLSEIQSHLDRDDSPEGRGMRLRVKQLFPSFKL